MSRFSYRLLTGLAATTIGFGLCPARAAVVINELHVDPYPKTSLVEFIELVNTGTAAVDLAGWSFTSGVAYTFPAGATLPAGGYAVVAGNPTAVQTAFGVTGVYGPWTGALSNEGETVTLRDASGNKVDEVSYQLGFPWPTVGDAPSYSMELLNPEFDNDLGGHWKSSSGVTTGSSTLLAAGASGWKYKKGWSEPSTPSTAWRAVTFNDSAWTTGALPIGFGETGLGTTLSDMQYIRYVQSGYTTFYLRRAFVVPDASSVLSLQAPIRFDDGFNMWINGVHVLSNNVSNAELAYTARATTSREDNSTVTFSLPNPAGYLVSGTNVVAAQVLNNTISSGDAFFDLALISGEGTNPGPTPGRRNSVYTTSASTALRQVGHTPEQPRAGETVTVTAKATDPDGVASMTLEYQAVNPGSYVRLTDTAYTNSANWTAVAMTDDGAGGDALAGDSIYTAQIPGSVQTHRRLVRYRIRAADGGGRVTPAPREDDPVPNFAYFVYNGVPDWQGSLRPGVLPVQTFPAAALTNIPVYHLLADASDVTNCQYNSAYNDDVYRWYGTLVYDGAVYDHVRYRIRGSASTYNTGKNKWKLKFNTGHDFAARDADGHLYPYGWGNLTLSALMCPWWSNDASTGGTILNETTAMDLYRLAGVPAIRSHFFHFRIIDETDEVAAASQYVGDFWGLYLAIEETEADYLESNGLPDGNVYNCNGSVAASVKRNQGPTAVQDMSDFSAEMSYTTGHHLPSPYQPYSYWTNNLALDNYYRFNTVNHLVNNTDMYLSSGAIERNLVYYRNPDTGLWWTLPWDLDLTFESAPHLSHPDTEWEHFWYVVSNSVARVNYENTVREVSDLLVRNGDAQKAVDAAAARICAFADGAPVETNAWPQANQAMWNYNPKSTKQGNFYANMTLTETNFVGYWRYLKTYVTTNGYGGAAVEAKLGLSGVPNAPSVTYLGAAGYPTDDLRFRVSDFSDTDGGAFAALQWRIAEITPTNAPGYPAVEGGIRYEINAAWSTQSVAFASDVHIPYETAATGHVYRVRARMQDNTGNWSRWSAPVEFAPSAPSYTPASAANLRITEIHYNPADNADAEFIELRNVGGGPINLAGAKFDKGVTFIFGSRTLNPGEFVLVVRNETAFASVYGAGLPVAGAYGGSLDNAGERVRLLDAFGGTIADLTYDDTGAWPGRADGRGSSIELTDPAAPNDGAAWRASSEYGGSPGREGAGPRSDLVINEVLTHTDPPLSDAVELFNSTDEPANIGGWHLSDSSDRYKKFRIPDGTVVPPRGYAVFDEADFNASGNTNVDFSFDGAHGDDVYLVEADASGNLISFANHESFGAALNGVSFGRWPNGSGRLYPQSARTFGAVNAGPRVGPVVLSEIQYNPGAGGFEYIELYNHGSVATNLAHWALQDAVDFTFPEPTILPAGGTLVVVGFDPAADPATLAAFQAAYGPVTPLGPWTGALDNAGEPVELMAADDPPPTEPAYYPLCETDRADYEPGAPWPAAANGAGKSLQRLDPAAWGDDPANWIALWPSVGRRVADAQRQAWYESHFTRAELSNPSVSGGDADPDGDGMPNDGEYAGDTDPRDEMSLLWLDLRRADSPGDLAVGFYSSPSRDYRFETATQLDPPDWTPGEAFIGTGGWMERLDAPDAPRRFYRLKSSVTP